MTTPVIRRTATVLALLASAVFAALAFADPAPPAASFDYSPASPLSGEQVTFTSTSSDPDGPLASEEWDLDEDTEYDDTSGASAQKTFDTPGDYIIALRVTDGDGNAETTSKNVSVGNRRPTADFGFSPGSPTTLQTVSFDSQSTDPDGTIDSEEWDLNGDGVFDDETGSVAGHQFLLSGNHTVGLRVTDNDGATDEVTKIVSIGNRSPSASFNASPGSPVTGQTIDLTSTSSDPDGSISGYAWDLDDDGEFDDGGEAGAQASFDDNGTYTIKLQVTDNDGATDVATDTVTVSNRGPTASFTASPASPETAETITFTSTSTDPDGSIASYAWDTDNDDDFDDGTGSTAQKAFTSGGNHTVRLRVTDDDGVAATAQLVVTVSNRGPSAGFGFSPSNPATGEQVDFTSSSSDPDGPLQSQNWDLDDDGEFDDASGASAQRAFGDNGTFTVRLEVTDSDGDKAVAARDVTVSNRGPSAFFDFTPTSPQTAEMVVFSSHSTDSDGTIASQAWDLDEDGEFDDGTGVTAQRPFQAGGTYAVELLVTDDDGATATYTDTITVANRAPTAGFSFLPVTPLTGEQVTFTSGSSDPDGTIESYAWDTDNDGSFDDGSNATAQKSFGANDTYTVKLRVTDDGGATDTTSRTVTVSNRPPTAAFTSVPASPLTGQTITFTSTSSDPDGSIEEHAWDTDDDGQFDDGTGATAQESFPAEGTYTIRLQVTDSDGAGDIVTHTVTVLNRAPEAGFGFTPPNPLTGQQITFTSSSTDPDGSLASQEWDLDNDGAFDDGNGSSAQHSFPVSDDYTVRLLVTDNKGATDIATREVIVGNRAPTATFGHSPASPDTNEPVTFTANASDPDGFVASYGWDLDDDGAFDDGSNATAAKSFDDNGTYPVKLRVTDNDGATAVSTGSVTIANRAPAASIGFTPATPITNQDVNFSSTSTDDDGTIASYAWDLDNNGQFDNGTGPTARRSFPSTGPYTVKLRVTDDDGAAATASVAITPGNQQPVAGFNFSPASPQTGQAVTFTSTATDPDGSIAEYAWDLNGDGQFNDGTGATATKAFDTPGEHTVSLQVTDNDGATDTISKVVDAANRGPAAGFGFTPASPQTDEEVTFTDSSTDPDGTIAAYAWDTDNNGSFNDGSGPTAQKAFETDGTYTVKLRVTDDSGATATATKTVTVANRAPAAFFQFAPATPNTGQIVTFTSASTDPDGTITGHAWDTDDDGQFDDGTSATTTKAYPTSGPHPVRLLVTDDSGATNVATLVVNVANRAPAVDVTASTAAPPTGQPVLFTANATDPDGTIASYVWDIDTDGLFDDGTGPTIQPSFVTNGFVTVRVLVTDDKGATAIGTRGITVLNRTPTANFTQGPAAPFTKEAVTFTSTSSDPDGALAAYAWDTDNDGAFDDGTGASAQRTFPDDGTFTVKLQVTDDDGGTDVVSKTVTVANRAPIAGFTYLPLAPNAYQNVTLTSSSTDSDGSIATYAWDLDNNGVFNNGSAATVTTLFSNVGSQTVRLRVTDDDGVASVATVEIFIGNRPPVSSFVYTPHNPVFGQQVNFFSTATDPDSTIQPSGLEWDLDGDGQYDDATGGAASRTFAAPGAYTVGLRVNDPDGAVSVYTDTVNVATPPPPAVTPQPGVQLISPFPVVRVAGRVYAGGTRLRMLSVNAPAGTTVTVRCAGKGCPFTSSRQSTASAGSRPATTIRIKRLEKRLLRSGVVVRIFITRDGAVGKFTSIKIRGRKSPLRQDRCLMPGQMKPVQCPS